MSMESLTDSCTPSVSVSDGTNTPVEEDPLLTQAVKVALHVRPLIEAEQLQGCKECLRVIPGESQVQLGNHLFRFDHIYGTTSSSTCPIFDDCVVPLVDGLFHGYNGTVLAYGQTGSGKTYTMGTEYTLGSSIGGIIPQVMQMVFSKIESLKNKAEFRIRVSFIEILKEKVHDLLDPNFPAPVKSEMPSGYSFKPSAPVKPLVQIRESLNGGIVLAGVTEVDVRTLDGMLSCLEQGALCRATASTNMNSCSSRSHAIFTIHLEQKKRCSMLLDSDPSTIDDGFGFLMSAKLHLVDLAGSERVKRTGTDGIRFKEGVHINKGLLALGNVINALGDGRKRKEGGHVPYRDSKLTRLLQDSLGGNSRTVMIACVSPADSNAEETLNTLKYASRARNIHNKPVININPFTAEFQRMRAQLESLQAELLCTRLGGGLADETKVLKQRIACLEATNAELRQELQESQNKLQSYEQDTLDAQGTGLLHFYVNRIQEMEIELKKLRDTDQECSISSPCMDFQTNSVSEVSNGEILMFSKDQSPLVLEQKIFSKDLEQNLLQNSVDRNLRDLKERLKLKEAELVTYAKHDSKPLQEKLVELGKEKKALQRERDALLLEAEEFAASSDEQTQKIQESCREKLKALESHIAVLEKKHKDQAHLLMQKQKTEEAAKHLQEEIQRVKMQKVQVQHKMKQESEQFRQWRASREKELVQLRKEGRKNEFEMLKLQALSQCQKMVLHRKTEEAAIATRRLKMLEYRKSSFKENLISSAGAANGSNSKSDEKILQQLLEHDLEIVVHIHEVRSSYEKQANSRSALAKELTALKNEEKIELTPNKNQDNRNNSNFLIIPNSTLYPDARHARIRLLEHMLNASSRTLVVLASQLSEVEEQERALNACNRWQHLKKVGDAKKALQLLFHIAAYARCQLWEKELENKDLKETIANLTETVKQRGFQLQEIDKQSYLREQIEAKKLTSTSRVGLDVTMACSIEELSTTLLQSESLELAKQKYSDCFYRFSTYGSSIIPYDLSKIISLGPHISTKQTNAITEKLSTWKRSYQRWLLHFKWKWKKPWRLSEWKRHENEVSSFSKKQ